MKKLTVKFLGGVKPGGESEIWGGSKATFNAFYKCLENNDHFKIDYITRDEILKNPKIISSFLENGDLIHVDDTTILDIIYTNGYSTPDVIGPISRSPIKVYKNNWKASYTKEWFYNATVIRLNNNEERKNTDLIRLIRHGVDTDKLVPKNNSSRKYVLWAGMIDRDAKNYPLMDQIMKITKLPPGYSWKILNKYNVEDYWKILDETCILVNTSKYESFCNALFEARAKGVATIQRILLNGPESHPNAPLQVEYSPEAYSSAILELLKDHNYIKVGKECREYCVKNASLELMRDDIISVYKDAYTKKTIKNEK